MNDVGSQKATGGKLNGYLSPVGIWALSFGAAVGWGAFAMPGTTFLPTAGPLGTAIGILIGALIMFFIGVNYHYLTARIHDAGGAYGFVKRAFGYDHAFLAAWFLILTYVAILWANATALSLFVRAVFGDAFQFGPHYTLAGFDVYLGEALLSDAAIVLFGLICAYFKKAAAVIQAVAAVAMILGIVAVFAAALIKNGFTIPHFDPAFASEDGKLGQIISIIALAPWAFVGFESISNSGEEFLPKVKRGKLMRTLVAAILTAAAAYVLLTLLSVTALPEGVSDWKDYVSSSGHAGAASLPTFFAAREALGTVGTVLISIAVAAGIITGLIANYVAGSRLVFAISRDGLFPPIFSKLTASGSPAIAILFIMLASLVIPFLGRTAIGWIVDVTTIGAAVAYAYVSLAAFKLSEPDPAGPKKRLVRVTATIGTMASVLLILYFLIPEIGRNYALSAESYLILVTWSVIGIVLIRFIIGRDKSRRTGRSAVVWVVLLVIVILISMLWVRQSIEKTTSDARSASAEKYEQMIDDIGGNRNEPVYEEAENYLVNQFDSVRHGVVRDNFIQMGIIIVSLASIFGIFMIIQKRESAAEAEKRHAEDVSRAKSTFLSNMSHDIRTPMNAIIGYTTIALREPDLPKSVESYLEKIDFSSRHLLSLINDVLDMSRIESGKMEIEPEPGDIVGALDKIRTIFHMQMEEKKINFTVDASDVTDRTVIFDENRLMRVLLNLISNAYKFTPEGGSVTVSLRQTASGGDASFELKVADTGIGMSPEFAQNVFRAFERERNKTVSGIQGTGLGMAITKNFIDLMGGSIKVDTVQGSGTTFTVDLKFPVCEMTADAEQAQENEAEVDFTGKKLLIVDDNPVNREIACMLLEASGFVTETAENGKEAFEKIKEFAPDCPFDAVLMDVNMPEMNGYDATRHIRTLDGVAGSVPVIAMSANAFAEDVQDAKDAGMNAHVAKPVEIDVLLKTLRSLIK